MANYLAHLPLDLQRLICLLIFPLSHTLYLEDSTIIPEPLSPDIADLLLVYSQITQRNLALLLQTEFGLATNPAELQDRDLLISRLQVNYRTVLDVKFSLVLRLGFLQKYQEYLSISHPKWSWLHLGTECYDSRVSDQVVSQLVVPHPWICFVRNSVNLMKVWFQLRRPTYFIEYTSYLRYREENEATIYYQQQIAVIKPGDFAYLLHNWNPSISLAALRDMETRVDYSQASHYLAPWLFRFFLWNQKIPLDYFLFWLDFLGKCKITVPAATWQRTIHRAILKIIRRSKVESWIEYLKPLYAELFRYPINSGGLHQQCFELKDHVARGFVQGLIQDLVDQGRLTPTAWLKLHQFI